MDKKGVWRLSPAYDMTFSYSKRSMWVKSHQMLINGKADGITKDDLISVAKKAGIKISEAEKCIREIKDSVSKWDEFAKESGLSLKTSEKIKHFFNESI